jgi:hypothetical protein
MTEKYLTDGRKIVETVPYLSDTDVNEEFVRGRDKYGEKVVFGTDKLLKSFGIYNIEPGTSTSLYATQILSDLKPKPLERKPEKLDYHAAG